MSEREVAYLGDLRAEIVRLWTGQVEGNLAVILTGERRRHYLEQHPEMVAFEGMLREALLHPDIVDRDGRLDDVAIFYKILPNGRFLRAAVILQMKPGDRNHSVMSYRIAGENEVVRNWRRRAWVRK